MVLGVAPRAETIERIRHHFLVSDPIDYLIGDLTPPRGFQCREVAYGEVPFFIGLYHRLLHHRLLNFE